MLALNKLSVVDGCTLNIINRTRLSHNHVIVFAAMYRALTVASGCYHRDRSVTYVSRAIVGVVQTFALTCSVWKKIALTLCVRKAYAVAAAS